MRRFALLLILACLAGSCRNDSKVELPDPEERGGSSALFAATSSFQLLPAPAPGDWLDVHDEEGQPFEDYIRSRPVRAAEGQTSIAFVPVGPFDERQQRVMQTAIEFAGLWFALETTTLSAEPLPSAGDWKRVRSEVLTQYHTDYFLRELLPDLRPAEAACLVGVTMGGLYPHESWNFVFGQADLKRRVGVYSLARFFAGFRGNHETSKTEQVALRRALLLIVHEIGHTFGLVHCITHSCTMNGSNSLDETDGKPIALCPDCLRKLQWNRGFDVLERYRGLEDFLRARGLVGDAAWFTRRLAELER